MTETIRSRVAELLRQGCSAYEVGGGPSRIIPMEGLRGLAVLLVFFVHFHALFGLHLPRNSVFFYISQFMGTIGNTGVDLFFVMSGYLIYGAVIRRQINFLKFMRRRVERIYPTFMSVLGLYLLLSVLFPAENKIHGGIFASTVYIFENLFLLPGIFHIVPIVTVAWSLSYEFAFYLSIPILVLVIGMRRWNGFSRLAFFLFVWILFALIGVSSIDDNRIRMISFLAGVVLYESVCLIKNRWVPTSRGELGACVLVLCCFILYYIVHTGQPTMQLNSMISYFPLSVSFFFFTLYCFEFAGRLQSIFSWAPLRYMGNMSYSYYLIHGVTLEGVAYGLSFLHVSKSSPYVNLTALLVGFSATWITASALFLFVEKKYSLNSIQGKGSKAKIAVSSSAGGETLVRPLE